MEPFSYFSNGHQNVQIVRHQVYDYKQRMMFIQYKSINHCNYIYRHPWEFAGIPLPVYEQYQLFKPGVKKSPPPGFECNKENLLKSDLNLNAAPFKGNLSRTQEFFDFTNVDECELEAPDLQFQKLK